MSRDKLDFEAAELEEFIQKYTDLDRRVQRPKGIFSILPGSRERQYQYTLQYFLNPQRPHGFGYTLLETLLNCIDFPQHNLTAQHIEIADEVRIADDDSERRIDLIVCGGNALSDHPRWAVFLELKVGAEEGNQQTKAYAEADRWNVSWFDETDLNVCRLEDSKHIYVKRANAPGPNDKTDTFESLNWEDLVKALDTEIGETLVEYPNRSVIQLTDFMRSLRETEGMDSDIDADELNERLNLYFEHSRLIQQVQEANSQFESDFEDLSSYLKTNWERELRELYDFETSGWKTSPGGNPKWQGILPEYWHQNPLNGSSTIKLFYRHSPTTDALRDGKLTFRLRLPPARNVHIQEQHSGESFNDLFTSKCNTDEYEARIQDALEAIGVDDQRLASASALVMKDYDLDPQNLTGSYFEQLATAVEEFCVGDNDLLVAINDIFEDTYQEVFDEEPAGSFPGGLPRRE